MPLAMRRSPKTPVKEMLVDVPFEQHLGVNRLSDRLSTPPDYFWAIKNGYVTKNNFVEQRNGFTVLTTAALTGAPKIRKVFEVENSTGSRTIIVRGGTRWARLNGTTFTDLDTGRGSDVKGQICQFNNTFIMCDGGAPRVSDMSFSVSNVSASSPSNASACHTHNHRVVMNNDANQMEVYISRVDSLNFDTSTSDAIVLNLSKVIPGGDKVLGFSTFLNTFLVIWMRRHVVVYNVPTTYASIGLQQVLNIGCVSVDGVYEVDGDLYFPSDTGYKSLKASLGTQTTLSLSDVTALIDPYYRSSLANISDLTDINGVFYQKRNHFYFTLPITSAPEIWCISKDLEVATKGKGNIAGFFSFATVTPYSFVERKSGALLFGADNGHLYTMDSGTSDNGLTIPFEWEKSSLYFGNPKYFKAIREFEGLFEATANVTAYIDYSYQTDGVTAGTVTDSFSLAVQTSLWDVAPWDTSYWDAAGRAIVKRRNFRGRGQLFNIRFRHNTLNAQIRMPYFILSLFNQGNK